MARLGEFYENQEFELGPDFNRAFVGSTFSRCLFILEEGATVHFTSCAFLHCAFMPPLGHNVSSPAWAGRMTNCTLQFDNAKSF